MLIKLTNTINSIVRKGLSVIRNGLKMWLPFEKSEILGENLTEGYDFESDWTPLSTTIDNANTFTTLGNDGIYSNHYVENGITYTATIEGTTDAVGFQFKNASDSEVYYSNAATGAFSSTFTFVSTAGSVYLRNTSAGTTTITTLKIKEVTQIAPDKSSNSNSAKLFTGKALSFDGVNDYVDLGSNITISTGAWTVACWVNTTTTPDNIADNILGVSSSVSVAYLGISDSLNLTIYDWGGSSWRESNTSMELNTYYRVVFSYDGSGVLTFYLNGVADGEVAIGTSGNDADLIVRYIGCKQNQSRFFDGRLSDFQLYDTAWTQADVTFDYNNPQHLVTDNSELRYGSEEVDNGDFELGDNGDWNKTQATISGGEVRIITTDGSYAAIDQSNVFEVGKTYSYSIDVKSISGTMQLRGGSGTDVDITTSGIKTGYIVPTSTGIEIKRKSSAGALDVTIDSISVKEIVSPTLNNLKGYWHLSEGDGSINYDSSGEGNDGTINGATWEDQQATIPQLGLMDWAKSTPVADEITLIADPNNPSDDILGNSVRLREHSLNLDGIGYAEVPDADNLDVTNYSIDGWFYSTNNSSGWEAILTKLTQDNFEIYIRNSQLRYFNSTDSEKLLASISLNAWTYFCITESGGTLKCYINDDTTPKSSQTVTQKFANTGSVYIGSHQSGDYSNALIDDVRIYNRALSSDEVEQNYKAGLNKHKASSSFSDDFSSDYGF